MVHDEEKSYNTHPKSGKYEDEGTVTVAEPSEDYYDPSKESLATRMGLTWESFKRAPGSTR